MAELQILGCHSSEKQKSWFPIQQQTLKGTVPLNDREWEYCKEAAINQASEETTACLAHHAKHYATQNRKRKKIDTPIKLPAENCIKYRLYPNTEQRQLICQLLAYVDGFTIGHVTMLSTIQRHVAVM